MQKGSWFVPYKMFKYMFPARKLFAVASGFESISEAVLRTGPREAPRRTTRRHCGSAATGQAVCQQRTGKCYQGVLMS